MWTSAPKPFTGIAGTRPASPLEMAREQVRLQYRSRAPVPSPVSHVEIRRGATGSEEIWEHRGRDNISYKRKADTQENKYLQEAREHREASIATDPDLRREHLKMLSADGDSLRAMQWARHCALYNVGYDFSRVPSGSQPNSGSQPSA